MSSSHTVPSSSVVPAQLSFLAIYNPSFGDTDETAYDQIFYFHSRLEPSETALAKDASLLNPPPEARQTNRAGGEAAENEQLRKVGLARGMVEFANTFSNGIHVDSIETEKSRIILQELEPGWWILASIDLTRLPAVAKQTNREGREKEEIPAVEYSSREVAPPQLLLRQLRRAHEMFLLHHAASLNELHSRLRRDLFCCTLERYWDRFVWDWDVLLHGNPAVDIYNSTRLAGGGELGMGVGEEEWGSGEREVLEDFVQRTEGMVDVLVGRYGDAPLNSAVKEEGSVRGPELWLGTGNSPRATDGIIFSGLGALTKRSLTTVSQWMEAIFRHGEGTYGVGENPTSRPRHRRGRRKHDRPANGKLGERQPIPTTQTQPRLKSPRGRAPDLRRKAMERNATPPGIPPPLVGSVERSLDQAIASVQKRENSQGRKDEDLKSPRSEEKKSDEDSSYFDTEKMMGILKLGYGSSWTLNPKGFNTPKDLAFSATSEPTTQPADDQVGPEQPVMQELDPTPDVSDTDQGETPFVQRLEQSIGKFIIGLSGDLENTEFEDDLSEDTGPEDSPKPQRKAQRLFMRTLNVQLSRQYYARLERRPSDATFASTVSKTDRLRVVLYTHQPFIFVFLFDLQTANLTMPSFYRSIHHQLGPLQKPLLHSTDPARIADRIASNMDLKMDSSNGIGLYDLVYDPVRLTVRTSIPNIPIPGTLAAEGILSSRSSAAAAPQGTSSASTVSGAWYTLGIPIGSTSSTSTSAAHPDAIPSGRTVKTEWTRIEALNVHSQILSMYTSTRDPKRAEIERTVKTGRGWWVVWMRVSRQPGRYSPTGMRSGTGSGTVTPTLRKEETDETMVAEMGGGEKEAFLVRKSADSTVRGKGRGEGNGLGSGRWLQRDFREVSGASGSTADVGTSARGVVEGVGVDARRWVEGLSRLS